MPTGWAAAEYKCTCARLSVLGIGAHSQLLLRIPVADKWLTHPFGALGVI